MVRSWWRSLSFSRLFHFQMLYNFCLYLKFALAIHLLHSMVYHHVTAGLFPINRRAKISIEPDLDSLCKRQQLPWRHQWFHNLTLNMPLLIVLHPLLESPLYCLPDKEYPWRAGAHVITPTLHAVSLFASGKLCLLVYNWPISIY